MFHVSFIPLVPPFPYGLNIVQCDFTRKQLPGKVMVTMEVKET